MPPHGRGHEQALAFGQLAAGASPKLQAVGSLSPALGEAMLNPPAPSEESLPGMPAAPTLWADELVEIQFGMAELAAAVDNVMQQPKPYR